MRQTLPNSAAVLVLGICSIVTSFFFIGIIFGIVGISLSSQGRKMYRTNPHLYEGYGLLNAGWIMSIIGTILGGGQAFYSTVYIPHIWLDWTIVFLIAGFLFAIILVIIYFNNGFSFLKISDDYIAQLANSHKANFLVVPNLAPVDYSDLKGIRIIQSSPKILNIIPGRLQIISGLDKGREIPIMGFPGPDGSILTIGREKGNSQSETSYIQLLEKSVSRKQAEIIFLNNKLFVKNLSETNFTRLNGFNLKVGEVGEVSPNSIIKTGEVEFKYIL